MATANDTTDGPALALSVLHEANDLLNILREHDTEGDTQMSSGNWTLTGEIKRRLSTAISHLNGSKGDTAGTAEPDAPAAQPVISGGDACPLSCLSLRRRYRFADVAILGGAFSRSPPAYTGGRQTAAASSARRIIAIRLPTLTMRNMARHSWGRHADQDTRRTSNHPYFGGHRSKI